MIQFRQATRADLPALMKIYSAASAFMQRSGNPNQWINGYPAETNILADIDNGHCVAVEDNGAIVAAFALIPGDDPTYSFIEGRWLDDEPYAVVHRLASSGAVSGIGEMCLRWCLGKYPNMRVDTHADNAVMQRILRRLGFVECGIIYTHNGTPRIAFQKQG